MDPTRLSNVIHKAVLDKLIYDGIVPMPLTPDQLRASVECVTLAVQESMKGRDSSQKQSIQKDATLRSFRDIPIAIKKVSEQSIPLNTSIKTKSIISSDKDQQSNEDFLPIDELVQNELRKRSQLDSIVGATPNPLTKLQNINILSNGDTTTLGVQPLLPQPSILNIQPSQPIGANLGDTPRYTPGDYSLQLQPIGVNLGATPGDYSSQSQLSQSIGVNLGVSPTPGVPINNNLITIISHPPSGIDSLRWEYSIPIQKNGESYKLLGISRLIIPHFLTNKLPYILLRVGVVIIPLFLSPITPTDSPFYNYIPDNPSHNSLFNIDSSNINISICSPDGEPLPLEIPLGEFPNILNPNILSGVSSPKSPDIVTPYDIFTQQQSEETSIRLILSQYSVSIFLFAQK
jgi:hypothetical protein